MIRYKTKPERYIENKNYAYAVCYCPCPLTYGLKLPKNKLGATDFECLECGLKGTVYYRVPFI